MPLLEHKRRRAGWRLLNRVIVDQARQRRFAKEGRIDPVLREPFRVGDEVYQCPSCQSWMLAQSWQDLNGVCACSFNSGAGQRIDLRRTQAEAPGTATAGYGPLFFLVCAIGFVGLLVLFSNSPSPNSTLTWSFSSAYPKDISIALYSKTRPGQSWPKTGYVWVLKPNSRQQFKIDCVLNEQVCYGAWEYAKRDHGYWGAGAEGVHICSNCCNVCDGSTLGHRHFSR